jgi:hypothetical protein
MLLFISFSISCDDGLISSKSIPAKNLPNYLAHWQIMFIFAASKDE